MLRVSACGFFFKIVRISTGIFTKSIRERNIKNKPAKESIENQPVKFFHTPACKITIKWYVYKTGADILENFGGAQNGKIFRIGGAQLSSGVLIFHNNEINIILIISCDLLNKLRIFYIFFRSCTKFKKQTRNILPIYYAFTRRNQKISRKIRKFLGVLSTP